MAKQHERKMHFLPLVLVLLLLALSVPILAADHSSPYGRFFGGRGVDVAKLLVVDDDFGAAPTNSDKRALPPRTHGPAQVVFDGPNCAGDPTEFNYMFQDVLLEAPQGTCVNYPDELGGSAKWYCGNGELVQELWQPDNCTGFLKTTSTILTGVCFSRPGNYSYLYQCNDTAPFNYHTGPERTGLRIGDVGVMSSKPGYYDCPAPGECSPEFIYLDRFTGTSNCTTEGPNISRESFMPIYEAIPGVCYDDYPNNFSYLLGCDSGASLTMKQFSYGCDDTPIVVNIDEYAPDQCTLWYPGGEPSPPVSDIFHCPASRNLDPVSSADFLHTGLPWILVSCLLTCLSVLILKPQWNH